MTLDEFTLDQGVPPADNTYCNPTFAADELMRSFEPFFLESVKPLVADHVVRHSFSKHGTKQAFNQKSQIAIRLTYCPDRVRGLRILAFSNPTEHRRRSYAGYDKKVDSVILSRKDRQLEAAFTEKARGIGFMVNTYSQSGGLILVALGSWHAGGCLCKVVIEMSISGMNHGDKHARPMFRHILHSNPLVRA